MMAAVIPRQITPLSPAEQQVCNFSRVNVFKQSIPVMFLAQPN